MKTEIIENKALLLGNNSFETGVISVPGGGTVPVGALLKRGDGNSFEVVTDTESEVPVAVNPTLIKNETEGLKNFSVGAIVGGKVRADMLSVAGDPTSEADNDLLRSYGIIPWKVTDVSRTDNQ